MKNACRKPSTLPPPAFGFHEILAVATPSALRGQPAISSTGLERAGAAIAFVLSAWMVTTTLFEIIAYYAPLPAWDQWEEVTIQQYLSHFFQQHNEHKIIFPRIIFIFDNILFRGSNVFNLAACVAIQAVHAFMLAFLMWHARPISGAARIWAACIAFSLLFWAYQSSNFTWGFQVQFVGVYAAATAAFIALAFATRAGVPLAVLFAGVAVFTMANGIVVPVLLVTLAMLTRKSRSEVVALMLTGGGLIAAFFFGYHLNNLHLSGGPLELGGNLLWYALIYLGAPFGFIGAFALNLLHIASANLADSIAAALGAAGLLLFGAITFALLRRARGRAPAQLVLLHIMGFVVITAMITALGRLQLGISEASEDRYGTPALVFWTAAIFLVWSLAPAGAPRLKLSSAVFATGVALAAALTQPVFMKQERLAAVTRSLPETALLARVPDTDLLNPLSPWESAGDFVFSQSQLLRDERLSIFADDWARWLGSPLADHVKFVATERCQGKIDGLEPISNMPHPSWRVHGWARASGGAAVKHIVLTAADGTVVGYALGGLEIGNEPNTTAGAPTIQSRWRGHMSLREPTTVSAYALLAADGEACLLQTAKPMG